MLHSTVSRKYLGEMADCGLLFEIFPELTALKGCPPNRHHHCNAWEHTLCVFNDLETMLDAPENVFSPVARPIERHLTTEKAALLKWAALLHDIGKPSRVSRTPDGSVHYYGHDKKGAEMAEGICRRLKMSNRRADRIRFIVRHHLRPLMLFNARAGGTLTPKGITRFFIRCGGWTPDVLIHAMADASGKTGDREEKTAVFPEFINRLLVSFFRQFQPASTSPPLITGRDLINMFGLSPSPLFKTILSSVEETRLSGHLSSREEALGFVGELLAKDKA